MSREKTYILRKPIKILETTKFPGTSWHQIDIENITTHNHRPVLTTELLNHQFVEFDEVAIRKKVTEMINTAYKIGYIHDTSYLSDLTVDDALEICVDAILRITTGETLGRKQ